MTIYKPTNSKNILRGTRLAYNYASQMRYKRELEGMFFRLNEVATKKIVALFREPVARQYFAEDASISSQASILMNAIKKGFASTINLKSKLIAERMVLNQNRLSSSSLKNSLKSISSDLTVSTNFLTKDLKEILTASIKENVNLIKSIGAEYLTQVEGDVLRSITTGNGLDDLIPALERRKGITYRRAKNIALDQTRKVYNNINKERLQHLGVEEYEWLHSGGGQHPRKDHIDMNGKIYRFDDPPVIDGRTGARGHPSEAINCKCTMRPIVRF